MIAESLDGTKKEKVMEHTHMIASLVHVSTYSSLVDLESAGSKLKSISNQRKPLTKPVSSSWAAAHQKNKGSEEASDQPPNCSNRRTQQNGL